MLKLRTLAMGLGALVAALPASAQSVMMRQATASVRIERPATLMGSRDLVFAIAARAPVVPGVRASARALGARATAPMATSLAQAALSALGSVVPVPAAASFVVAGDSGQSISVVVPDKVALVRDGGAETAVLTTTASLADGPQFLAGNFESGGALSFDVGGQVMLASNQAVAGTYNGVLAVVAQYN